MVDEISTRDLRERVRSDDDVQVIDIREPHEVGPRVPGADHVPMSELTLELGARDWGDEIYVICCHGNSSIQAVRLLESYEGVAEDATVASVAGGYVEWDWEVEDDGTVVAEPTEVAAAC
jgi:rhodanese-related sulfurtransferase